MSNERDTGGKGKGVEMAAAPPLDFSQIRCFTN